MNCWKSYVAFSTRFILAFCRGVAASVLRLYVLLLFIAVLCMSLKAPLSSTALQERPLNRLCPNWWNSVWPVVHTMLAWESNKGETSITSSWGMKFRYVRNEVHLVLFIIAEFLVEERIWEYQHVFPIYCVCLQFWAKKLLVLADRNRIPGLCFRFL